jgi:hypothetical protein
MMRTTGQVKNLYVIGRYEVAQMRKSGHGDMFFLENHDSEILLVGRICLELTCCIRFERSVPSMRPIYQPVVMRAIDKKITSLPPIARYNSKKRKIEDPIALICCFT